MSELDIKTSTNLEDTTDMPVPTEEQATSVDTETAVPEKEIIDIQMASPKKTYRINGDNNCIIELNPSDLNVIVRIKEVYAKLNNMAQRAGALLVDQEEATTEKSLNKIAKALTELDAEMKDMVDYIFDSKVSDVLAQGTNMYSPVNGEFWFEHCIDVLIGLYNANFSKEMRKMKEQVQKQTSKYSYMR
jgi:phage-related protein